jgi:hypothetical protein
MRRLRRSRAKVMNETTLCLMPGLGRAVTVEWKMREYIVVDEGE